MGYITKFGSFWGFIPQTMGRVFWVAASASYTVEGRTYSASDDNDGLSPERAVLTLARAVALASASVGDVIVMLPGSHSYATSVALSKAGITVTGIPGGAGHPLRQRASVTISIDDQIANVTAADVEIAYLHFVPVTTKAAVDFTTAADRLHIHHCSVDLFTAAANTGTAGFVATTIAQAPSEVYINDCYFLSDGAQGPGVYMGDTYGYVVEDCIFEVRTGVWAVAAGATGATSQNGIWRRNHFSAQGGTMTVGILGTDTGDTGKIGIYDCRFDENVTKPIDDFTVEDCNIAQNYQASADGTAEGGLLWSSTT